MPKTILRILIAGGLAVSGLCSAEAGDVSFYFVGKGRNHLQTNAAAPVLDTGTPYYFTAVAYRTSTGGVYSVSGKRPDGVGMALSWDALDGEYRTGADFSSAAMMDAQFGSGAYELTFNTQHDGVKTAALTLTGDNYPNAPQVSNYTAAQAVNVNTDFALFWQPFSGGAVTDYIQLRVYDSGHNTIFETPEATSPTALNGLASSTVIPAHVLTPGQAYQAKLVFVKVTYANTTSYAGVFGGAGYIDATDFMITTAADTPSASDVSSYGVIKGLEYGQAGAGAPTLNMGLPYAGTTLVFPSAANAVAGAAVKLPGGATRGLPWNAEDGRFDTGNEDFATQAALDAAWPVGQYVLTINTVHQGVKTLSLNLPADAYPNPPHVANFDAAQAINAAGDFTMSWDAFQSGASSDWIELKIDSMDQTVFRTPSFGMPGALNGTAASVVIPANTLAPGQRYDASLRFFKFTTTDTQSYPGAVGFVIYEINTDFSLATQSSGTPPDVRHYSVYKGWRYVQTGASQPGLSPSTPYYWSFIVDPQASNTVAGAVVQTPTGAFKSPVWTPINEMYGYSEYFPSQAALDTTYPNGNYTFLLNTVHDGSKSLTLNLTGDNYPAPLQVANYNETQRVDASKDFRLQWLPAAGAQTNDHIRVFIVDQQQNRVFATLHENYLPATDSSIVIPAATFQPGKNYSITLWYFRDVAEGGGYPGAGGTASYLAVTLCNLTAAALAPRFESITRGQNGARILSLRGQTGQFYRLEATADFLNWAPITNLNAPSDVFDMTDAEAGQFQKRFYRAVIP